MPEISQSFKTSFQTQLLDWYQESARKLPWRLNPTPYAVAVAELMCQQTQIETVLSYYARWMQKFKDWETLAETDEKDVLKSWEGLGYYRRAKALHALARAVVYELNGELPSDVEKLVKLPGIGPYTAGAISSVAFQKRAALVDGNVERVFARTLNLSLDLAENASRRAMWEIAEILLPSNASDCGDYNQALMELGATICLPKKPMCVLCPIQKLCQAKDPENLPVKTRVSILNEEEWLGWIWNPKEKMLWLELPEKPRRWSGCYRLPSLNINSRKRKSALFKEMYTITRYRVSAHVTEESLSSMQIKDEARNGKWFKPEELEQIFLPAPHRRMIEKALHLEKEKRK